MALNSEVIAVFGATGTIGSRVVSALLSQGSEVLALVRKPLATDQPGLKYVSVDLNEMDSLAAALKGVDKVFLLCPNGPTQLQMELNAVKAAAQQQVKHLVKLSVLGASPDSPIAFGRLHAKVEEAAKATGMACTFVRPNMFMQNLFWYKTALQQGTLPLPLGDAAVSHVDAEDVGMVAARALLQQTADSVITVTGPEALTGEQAAAALSRGLHRKIEYHPLSSAEFGNYLKSSGQPEEVADSDVELFAYWSQGHGSSVTNVVAEFKGSDATNLETFASRESANLI